MKHLWAVAIAIVVGSVGCGAPSEAPSTPPPQTIRCAVIGGMAETGLWPELAERYQRMTGNRIEVAASGPKPVVDAAFRKGGIDLVTYHAGDAFVELVADGLARDPQPWLHNDFVIVGPHEDPAGIRGERDAAAAMKKLIDGKQPFLVAASQGADGVVHELLEGAHLVLPAAQTIVFDQDNQHALLAKAAEAHAYTLVGRIPFLSKKLAQPGMELMVTGDARLRRPYLVAVAAGKPDDPRLAAARAFVAYLRSPETQAWLATFGKGKYDDAPLFFPIKG